MYDDFSRKNFKWWLEKDKDIHESLHSYINHLDTEQAYKSSDNHTHMKLYGNYNNLNPVSFGANPSIDTLVSGMTSMRHKVTLNIVQSIIDTVVSRMDKNRPRVQFLTDGGDYTSQKKAKNLTKFTDGLFASTKIYKKAIKAFLDSAIFGTGCLKIYKCGKKIKVERVFIDEIKVDDNETLYTDPKQMFQIKYMQIDDLIALFPEKEAAILNFAKHDPEDAGNPFQQSENIIKVIEAWRLPSGEDGKDGKHSIIINGCTLLSETYEKNYFPFVFFRWSERPIGFFGQGLAEQLKGIQLEINKILRTIQVSMHLVSVPKLLIEASSKIVTSHLNNKIGGIIKYAGNRPEYAPLGSIPAELFTQVDRLYQRGYEIAGVSQMSAQSVRPVGVESGKAFRTLNDIQSERFLSVGRRYEDSFIDAAHIMIDLARDISKEEGGFSVNVKGHKFLEKLNWKEIDLEDDKFVMQAFPVSALSTSPTGRLQDVIDLMDRQLLSKEQAIRLLDFPDLESAMSLESAAYENILAVIENLTKGKYIEPQPFQNLTLGVKMVQEAYLKYMTQDMDDEKLDLFIAWMDQANAMLDEAQQVTSEQQAMDQQAQQQLEPQAEMPMEGEMPLI